MIKLCLLKKKSLSLVWRQSAYADGVGRRAECTSGDQARTAARGDLNRQTTRCDWHCVGVGILAAYGTDGGSRIGTDR